jgi:predicted transcriptional regulator
MTDGDTEIELDEFFKSLMFQRIMDGDFSRNERDTLLVIFRKTLHFEKVKDSIGMHWLAKAVGIGANTLRDTIEQLEAKGLISIGRSKGGRGGARKFNTFAISNYMILDVYRHWEEIKLDNDFTY